jgi:hypothetical protein
MKPKKILAGVSVTLWRRGDVLARGASAALSLMLVFSLLAFGATGGAEASKVFSSDKVSTQSAPPPRTALQAQCWC